MDNKIDLSIILINYNAAQLTAQAITSILDTTYHTSIEIIVVENGGNETETLAEGISHTKVLRNIENKGFGHACNVGAAVAQGEYLLFLNNDTIMHHRTIDESVTYIRQHSEVGALGVQMLLPNGELDHGCKRGFATPIASFYYFSKLDRIFPQSKTIGAYRQGFVPQNSIAAVDVVSGAFMLISKHLFQQTDGFDEAYFMYGEDVDICYRIKQLGYQNIYYGAVAIVHLKGQSGLHTQDKRVLDAFYQSMEIFYDKHYQQKYGKVTSFLVKTAIQFKYKMALQALQKGKNS